MTSLSNSFIENYIQRVTELSQSPQRIPSATELEKMAADLGLSPEEIESAQKQSQEHLTRAQGYMRLKHWDEAIEELTEAVALCPSNEDLLLSLAAAHLGRWYQRHRRDDVENVRLRVRECLSIQPDSEEALNLLAKLDKALRWRRTLLVGWVIGLGSFLTTISLLWLRPESLVSSWGVLWHRSDQLEQLEQRLLGEIQALRQEQEQLRQEVLSSQTAEKQRYQNGLAQLHERLKRLEQEREAWQDQLQKLDSTGGNPVSDFDGAGGFDSTAGTNTNEWLENNPNFNWYDLWNTGSTEPKRTFQNVNGSGIDVTVEYSTGQRWQSSNGNRLNLYDNYELQKHSDNDSHNLWIYHGTLRFTNNNSNDNSTPPDSSFVKITFSEPVYIDNLWAGSLSTIGNKREWMKVHAYSTDGIDFKNLSAHTKELVSPSQVDHYEDFFNTTCTDSNVEGAKCNYDGADNPNFVEIIANKDGSVTLKAKGSQGSQQYGRAFFEYANTPVKTIVFEHFVTDTNDDASGNNGYTSVAISPNLVFSKAGTSAIADSDNDGLMDSQDPNP